MIVFVIKNLLEVCVILSIIQLKKKILKFFLIPDFFLQVKMILDLHIVIQKRKILKQLVGMEHLIFVMEFFQMKKKTYI